MMNKKGKASDKDTSVRGLESFPTNIFDTSSLPAILVTKSSMPPIDEYVEEIRELWGSRWITNMGIKHQLLQKQLRDYLGVCGIDLLTNGHMALELSIQALDIEGEVITTPFTFASTTHAIIRNGLKPVFCDIREDDYTIDSTKLESLVTNRTSAILPVHVYGNICDIEAIQQIAEKYNLKVIYDAAHAFGETYKGIGIGAYGDVSCLSFHATKVFNTIEGGAVCFKDTEFGYRIARLKNFGFKGPEIVDGIGTNAKMNEFCAAMGICNLRHINEEIEKRKRISEVYRNKLKNVEGIKLNVIQEKVKSNYAYFPIIIDEKVFGSNRNQVMDALAAEGIGARKYFYPLTNTFDCFHGAYNVEETPIALHISERVLALPIYADLALDSVNKICDVIIRCKK